MSLSRDDFPRALVYFGLFLSENEHLTETPVDRNVTHTKNGPQSQSATISAPICVHWLTHQISTVALLFFKAVGQTPRQRTSRQNMRPIFHSVAADHILFQLFLV